MNSFSESSIANFSREENILILPYNTLRIVDVPVQIEIERFKNPKYYERFDKIINRMIGRPIKDLGKYNNVNSEVVNDSIKNDFAKYYDIAPESYMYQVVNLLNNQAFTKSITVLFSDNNAKEPLYQNAYYDGSIDELERFIDEHNITAIFMDDVDLLDQLTLRKNVDMNWKTIFISKIGYNYYRTEAGLRMKKIEDIEKRACLEIGALALTDLSEVYRQSTYYMGKDDTKL